MRFVTQRLILRPFTQEDAEDVFQYASEEGVGIHAGWAPHKNITESGKVIEMFMSEELTLAIVNKLTMRVIGSISLMPSSKRVGNCRELGYSIGKSYWGCGYMIEAVQCLIQFAFLGMQLDFVEVSHYDYNLRSRRVIEKAGFEYEGTIHNHKLRFDGEVINLSIYYLTRDRYLRLTNNIK